jgi:hypothetical protein
MIAGPTPIEPSAPQQAIAASAVASPAVGAKPLDLSYFLAEENLSARRKAKVSPINFSAESGQLAATDQIFGLGLWN